MMSVAHFFTSLYLNDPPTRARFYFLLWERQSGRVLMSEERDELSLFRGLEKGAGRFKSGRMSRLLGMFLVGEDFLQASDPPLRLKKPLLMLLLLLL